MIRKLRNIDGPFLKKFKLVFLIIVVVSVVGLFWWPWATGAVAPEEEASKVFVIKKGESLSTIANRLKQAGLIRSSLAFKLIVLTEDLSSKIQAGDFQLKPSLTTKEIAEFLTYGTTDIWLTFPEGWRREEIARRLANNLTNFDSQEFLSLTNGLEGSLFPDTYLIPKDASAEAVLNIFQKNFEKKFSSEVETAARKKGFTKSQVLILASIVERETKENQDRPIVAGILIKRWQNDWPLQADATLQYAKGNPGNWWPIAVAKDKQIESAYNTYKYKGLPTAPICNPGLTSIKAVINLQQTTYWFYLSDKEGNMHYAKTSEEHNQNIVRYLN